VPPGAAEPPPRHGFRQMLGLDSITIGLMQHVRRGSSTQNSRYLCQAKSIETIGQPLLLCSVVLAAGQA
jgi:hypothetical protein